MTQFTCKGVKQINNRISFTFVSLDVFHQRGSSKWGISRNIDCKMQVKILLYLIFLLGGYRAGGKGVCGRLMSPAHETQSMREIRLLRGRLPRKGGGLTGMLHGNHSTYLERKVHFILISLLQIKIIYVYAKSVEIKISTLDMH